MMFMYIQDDGQVALSPIRLSVPDISETEIMSQTSISLVPSDKLFRRAWKILDNELVVDLVIAKDITHEKRRERRDTQFKPFDDIISKQIPGDDSAVAELERVIIRNNDALLQLAIDAVIDETTLRELIISESL